MVTSDGVVYDRQRDPPGQRSIYIPPGDPFLESYRLSTFMKFPMEIPVNPRHLASSGFYYTGYKDRVKCFSCGLCVEQWEAGDNVRSARWHQEDCKFLKGLDSGNVPVGGGGLARFLNPSSSFSTRSANFTSSPAPSSQAPRAQSMPAPGNERQPASQGVYSAPHPRQTASIYNIVEFANIPSSYHEHFLKSLDLRKESERIRTFEHWPNETPTVSSNDLARSGFFYLGNLDRVQCFSCAGVLRNWNYGDNVQAEHRRHFPHCRLVQGAEERNVVLTEAERAAVPRQQNIFEEPPDPSENEQRDLRNMFQCQFPVNPHMRNEDVRFETFDHRWNANNVDATPRQIARAGFFFLGEWRHLV
uniref:ZF(RING)-14 zinc finger protein n=1 Tax=Phallusia mammillata TaxID=59560 RepID=A0A6F9D6V2_9ASCI|nr:ZF(RING)-14 zinc finger protein [Phallusia mammillata]